MSKIGSAQDILADARNCVECIFLAAANLDEDTDPIQTVANMACKKINEAIAILEEYRGGPDANPVVAEPSVKPVSPAWPAWPAWRTKRKGK